MAEEVETIIRNILLFTVKNLENRTVAISRYLVILGYCY